MNIGISKSLGAIALTYAHVLNLVSSWVPVGIFTWIIQFLDKSWTPEQPDSYLAMRREEREGKENPKSLPYCTDLPVYLDRSKMYFILPRQDIRGIPSCSFDVTVRTLPFMSTTVRFRARWFHSQSH